MNVLSGCCASPRRASTSFMTRTARRRCQRVSARMVPLSSRSHVMLSGFVLIGRMITSHESPDYGGESRRGAKAKVGCFRDTPVPIAG
jgi:hypothetical protein